MVNAGSDYRRIYLMEIRGKIARPVLHPQNQAITHYGKPHAWTHPYCRCQSRGRRAAEGANHMTLTAGVGTHGHCSTFGRAMVGSIAAARRQVVECERHLVALDIDLKNAIDRLPDSRQFAERTAEKLLLCHAVDARNDDDKASV